MNARAIAIRALGVGVMCGGAAGSDVAVWSDPVGDAVIRRTDPGNNGPLHPLTVLPDVVEVRLSGWKPTNPVADPYAGVVVKGEDADIFRLDVDFAGVVNPPGPLGVGAVPFDPFRFGVSPVYGFLEVDVDDDKDTGGELIGATNRYLANVARFGRVPYGSIGERAAIWAKDYDGNFFSEPFFERSGADFVLTMCGCWNVTIVSEGGNGNGVFEAGETWIVRGRFFQRSGGYKGASTAFGGSNFGLYDPLLNLRFSHSMGTGRTTVTLVYALNMAGAAQLAGQPQQPINKNVGDHTSVVEALADIIANAGNLSGPVHELTKKWKGRDPFKFINPVKWECRGLFGTSYSEQQFGAMYVWTDTGFAETHGDLDTDGLAWVLDRKQVLDAIAKMDGGPDDADGIKNGAVVIVDFGPNFNLHDVNGDGVIDGADVDFYCLGDFNGDGVLTVEDFVAFQIAFALGDPKADLTGDGVLNIDDYVAFQVAYAKGC